MPHNQNCNFATIKSTAQIYKGALTEASLRWWIFNDTDGFNRCLRRVGRKILINLEELENFLDAQKGEKNGK